MMYLIPAISMGLTLFSLDLLATTLESGREKHSPFSYVKNEVWEVLGGLPKATWHWD